MRRKAHSVLMVAMAVMVMFSLGACHKKTKVTNENSVSGTKQEPEWVTRCSGAFKDAGKDAFYGCGSASSILMVSLLQQTADSRARDDLAKTLDTYVASFFKDYMSSSAIKSQTDKTGLTELEEKQFVSSISKNITEVTLYGAMIVDRWKAPDGTLWSLCKVSFDNVAETMKKQMKERSKEVKLEADDAVKELDQQLQKRREAGM